MPSARPCAPRPVSPPSLPALTMRRHTRAHTHHHPSAPWPPPHSGSKPRKHFSFTQGPIPPACLSSVVAPSGLPPRLAVLHVPCGCVDPHQETGRTDAQTFSSLCGVPAAHLRLFRHPYRSSVAAAALLVRTEYSAAWPSLGTCTCAAVRLSAWPLHPVVHVCNHHLFPPSCTMCRRLFHVDTSL